MKEKNDPINPNVYKHIFEPLEMSEVIYLTGLNWFEGNYLKYVTRAGCKPGVDKKTDLDKAIRYLEMLGETIQFFIPGETKKITEMYLLNEMINKSHLIDWKRDLLSYLALCHAYQGDAFNYGELVHMTEGHIK